MRSTATQNTTTGAKYASRREASGGIFGACIQRRVRSTTQASVTFNEADELLTVLTGRGSRSECFCRVVPRKGQNN